MLSAGEQKYILSSQIRSKTPTLDGGWQGECGQPGHATGVQGDPHRTIKGVSHQQRQGGDGLGEQVVISRPRSKERVVKEPGQPGKSRSL